MNIVVANAHWNNRGDEAAHRALWGELRKLYPDATVKVLIKDRTSVEQFLELHGFCAELKRLGLPIWGSCLLPLSRGYLGLYYILTHFYRLLSDPLYVDHYSTDCMMSSARTRRIRLFFKILFLRSGINRISVHPKTLHYNL